MSDLEQRLTYLNMDGTDLERLRCLAPLLEKHADTFVASFYRQLLSFGPTRDLLADPAVKERLLSKQREYLLSLGNPRLDEAFLAERRRIGHVHARVGLEPRWYLGAYALYFSLLTPIICDAFSQDPEDASQIVVSLQKQLMLDAQLAMEAYIDTNAEQLEYLTRELAEHSRQLARDFDDQSATLRRTTEQARAAEELASIATLVAGLAHEIGTPMGVIQGHAKMLESAVSGDDARWRLSTIQQQIGRISRIIQMLLNMARPGRSRRQPVALEPLLETTLSFLSAMPDGGELGIALSPADGEVVIRISDSGAGIAEADLERVFDPFFTTKPAGEGNGLGLMVCKGIVGDHGGTIEAFSRAGEGSEFVIRLPVAAS
jgi:signal transduction histidine kinase